MTITKDVFYVGVNDHAIDLFEGQYPVPNGMAYNSYVILDEKIAVLDTVDARFGEEWLSNVKAVLQERTPTYLVIHHMEPDHSANITKFMNTYPGTTVIASHKAFEMMRTFFGEAFEGGRTVVVDGDILSLGKHELTFIAAPMVHWPEVMMSYDRAERILFSADAFGKFGALDREEPWEDEARRYYIGIVGKYGSQVQSVLQKAAKLDIRTICPLHGPVLKESLDRYLGLYQLWSSYEAEENGIVIAYTSIYGHTAQAVKELASMLSRKTVLYDLARADITQVVAQAFRYDTLVLATTTYNADVFPFMRTFLQYLSARNFQKRTVALIENGSWVPTAASVMEKLLSGCKHLHYAYEPVTIRSALNVFSREKLRALASELNEI